VEQQMSVKIPYSNTTIPPERTKGDIEKLLKEHGIQDIQWTTYKGKTVLKFLWKIHVQGVDKEIMFQFTPPIIASVKRSWTGVRYEKVHVNLEATSYRLLWHYLKNKLEAVRWNLESMEKEFLSHAVVALPNGQEITVGEQIEKIYETVSSPALGCEKKESKIVEGELVEERA